MEAGSLKLSVRWCVCLLPIRSGVSPGQLFVSLRFNGDVMQTVKARILVTIGLGLPGTQNFIGMIWIAIAESRTNRG